jgi:hypothetical protein
MAKKKIESLTMIVKLIGKPLEMVLNEKKKYDDLKIQCSKSNIVNRLIEGRKDSRLPE